MHVIIFFIKIKKIIKYLNFYLIKKKKKIIIKLVGKKNREERGCGINK